MNGAVSTVAAALVSAVSAVIVAAAYWIVAARVAGRRGAPIGAVPAPLVALVACSAAIAASSGVTLAPIAALAGVTVAGWVDARTGFIFDRFSLAFGGISATLCIASGSARDSALGAVCTGGALLLIYAVTRGRGLGLGDVKLGSIIGLALGALDGFVAIGLAFVFGATYGVALLAGKRATATTPLRFGPFIAAGTYAAIFVPALTHR